MKPFLTFLLLLLALPVFGQTNVVFTLTDFSLTSVTGRTVIVTPESTPGPQGSSVVIGDKLRYRTTSAGTFTVTNMAAGVYLIEVAAPPSATRFRVYVESGNANTNGHDLLVATATSTFPVGTVAWSAAVTDARYARLSQISTNSFTTNTVGDIAASLRSLLIGTNAGSPVYMVTNSGGLIVGFINTNAFSGGSGDVTTAVLNTASNALAAMVYALGTQSTNYTLAASNTLWTATSARQGGSQVLSNAANTGVFTNGLIAGSNMTLTTNGAHQVVFTASLAGGAASLGDITNVVADLTGTGAGKSNFISEARLTGSNYLTGLLTNANQFAANTTLTLKTGAYLTNAALDRATNFVHGMEFPTRYTYWESNKFGIITLASLVPNPVGAMFYNIGSSNNSFGSGYFFSLNVGNYASGGSGAGGIIRTHDLLSSGSSTMANAIVTNFYLYNSPSAGYVLTSDGVGTGTWQANPALGVSNQLTTASNYFNARQDGSLVLTNLTATGAMTNGLVGAGGVTLTTNGSHQVVITGASGSTNLTTLATGSLTAGDVIVTNNVSAGTLTITNLAITFDTVLVSDANTNLTLNFNRASSDIYLTNSTTTFTNIAGLVSTNQANLTLRITPVGANRLITWPTLGGNSFGARFLTNANSPIWTTITNTVVVSMSAWGTNVHISMSEWK